MPINIHQQCTTYLPHPRRFRVDDIYSAFCSGERHVLRAVRERRQGPGGSMPVVPTEWPWRRMARARVTGITVRARQTSDGNVANKGPPS